MAPVQYDYFDHSNEQPTNKAPETNENDRERAFLLEAGLDPS